MKKNVIFRIAAIVLMCTLVTACFASSTFAKYTSNTNADKSTVTVAKWDITYDKNGDNETQIAIKPSATVVFNVFDTITDMDGNMDTEVVNAEGKNTKIAPGTKGQFTIADITNDSEVAAKIGVKIVSVTDNDIPLKFYSDSAMTEESDITDKIVAGKYIVGNNTLTDGKDVAIGETLQGTTVYWQWVFEDGRDEADTDLGIAGQTTAPTYEIELQIEATQLD